MVTLRCLGALEGLVSLSCLLCSGVPSSHALCVLSSWTPGCQRGFQHCFCHLPHTSNPEPNALDSALPDPALQLSTAGPSPAVPV